jgi:RND family efflux transporter MFP subunit
MTSVYTVENELRQRHAFRRPRAILLAMLGGASLAGGCEKGNAGPATGPAMGAMPVQVQIVRKENIAETSEYLSILKSRHSAAINPQVEGQIVKIFVKSGDRVSAGTPLLQIDPRKQEATVGSQEAARAAQEANLQFAKISLERAQKLFDAGVISKQDLDYAQTNYSNATAQLKSLDEQVKQQKVELHYYSVVAPMDGIVGDIPVRTGDRVTVASLLTTLDEPGALEAYVYVPADQGKNLKVGLPVKLLDESGNRIGESRIGFVSSQVDPETQSVLAKAPVENAQIRLRVAQQVRAQVTWKRHEGAVVPVLSVVRINGRFFGFVASKENNGTFARQKSLVLGDTIGNDFAVIQGLQPGDHLITSGLQFMQDGMPVSEQIQADGKNAAAK